MTLKRDISPAVVVRGGSPAVVVRCDAPVQIDVRMSDSHPLPFASQHFDGRQLPVVDVLVVSQL